MGAPKKDPKKKKGSVNITPSKEVQAFIAVRVETGEFSNPTHGFERAVRFYKKNEDLAREQLREEARAKEDKSLEIKTLEREGDGAAR